MNKLVDAINKARDANEFDDPDKFDPYKDGDMEDDVNYAESMNIMGGSKNLEPDDRKEMLALMKKYGVK